MLLAAGVFVIGPAALGCFWLALRWGDGERDDTTPEDEAFFVFDLDPITGMGNERAFAKAIGRRRRDGSSPTSVISVSVDDIARTGLLDSDDDAGGDGTDGGAGRGGTVDAVLLDLVLSDVADAISRAVRPTDVAFRRASTRFTVLLPGATAADAGPIAERVRREVAVAILRRDIVAVVSAGVASGPAHVARAIAHTANDACSAAQRRGGDRVEYT